MVAVVGRMANAVDAISRNTISTKNLQKEVCEALLPIDLEIRIKMKAFEQLGDEVKASQFLALDNDTRKIYVLGSLDLL